MKFLFNFFSAVIVLGVIFLASLNPDTVLNLVFWGQQNTTSALDVHIDIVHLILFIFIAGILAGAFWAESFNISVKDKLKEYQRKLEKTSVQSSEDTSKVEVLEAKIQVLEKALQSALEKNS